MFAVVGFLCLSIAHVVPSKGQCSAGQQCHGAVSASMLQTHSHESHATGKARTMATARAVATQSANITANLSYIALARRDRIQAMMNKRRSQNLDAIKKDIGDELAKNLKKKTEFEKSELFEWVSLLKSSPLGEVAVHTKEKAVYFWNQLKEALKDPLGTIKMLLDKWVPDLKTEMDRVHEELKTIKMDRFFNGQAIKSFLDGDWKKIGLDFINILMESKSLDGNSKPGFERYLDAIVFISQEVEIGEIVGQILEGAMGLLKEVQDSAITMISKGLAAVDATAQGAVELGPLGDTIKLFANMMGIDAEKLDDGKRYWEGVLSDWSDAKDDIQGWWAGLNLIEQGIIIWDMLDAPKKAVLITVGWNSIAMVIGCEGCFNVNGCSNSRSLAQVSNLSVADRCASSIRAMLVCNDDTSPSVETSINDEAGSLNGAMHEVDNQLEVWSLKETISSSSQSLSEFFEGVEEE